MFIYRLQRERLIYTVYREKNKPGHTVTSGSDGEKKNLISLCVNDAFCSCKVEKYIPSGLFPSGSGSHLNNCCVPHCVDRANWTRFSSLCIRGQCWLAVRRELITHSQIHSSDCKHNEFNTNKHWSAFIPADE